MSHHGSSGRRAAARAVAAAVAFAAVLAGTGGSPAHGQSPGEEAEALIRQGLELRHQNQDTRALPLFERAYQLARSPRTAGQLGLAKMSLGYWVDAERLLDEALAAPDHPWIARNAAALEQSRAAARKSIGELAIAGGPAGAEVLINGRPVGTLPLAAPIRLDKGPVEVQVRAPGRTPVVRSLTIAGGARESVSVTLAPAPGSPGAAGLPMAPSPAFAGPDRAATPAADIARAGDRENAPGADSGPSSVLRPLAWAAAAGVVAGLALGIIETVAVTNRIDDFNNHTIASPTPSEPNRRVPDCATDQLSDACRSISDAHDRALTLAVVGYVGAAVLAGTSAALFVLSARRAPPRDAATATVAAFACAPALPAPGVACRLAF